MTDASHTAAVATRPAPPDALERVLFMLAVLALALAPTQLVLMVKGIPLHPSEPLLLLGALVWGVRWLRVRDHDHLPPLAHWVLVLAVALGVFASSEGLQLGVVKEAAQFVLYLLFAYPIFRTTLTSPRRVRLAATVLLATTTLAVLLAVFQRVYLQQHMQLDPAQRHVFAHRTPLAYLVAEAPFQVCSTFASWSDHGYHPSRSAYAGFLALVLPFALALLVSARKHAGMLIWLSAFFALTAISVLAGYLVPAILAGLVVTGFAMGRGLGVKTLAGVALYLIIVATVGGINRMEVLREPFDPRVNAVEARYRYEDGTRHLKRFWGEHLAALTVVRSSPLLGVGAGEYGDYINQNWTVLGKVEKQRSEPGLLNGYLQWAAETGLLGLAALMLLFGTALGRARRAAVAWRGSPWTAALLGTMTALLLLTLATNPWVRGLMVVIVALLGALGHFATHTPEARIEGQEETPCA